MTRIAVSCEGTWNGPNSNDHTHVLELHKMLENHPGRGQAAVYFGGMGGDDRFGGPAGQFRTSLVGVPLGGTSKLRSTKPMNLLSKPTSRGIGFTSLASPQGAFNARAVAGLILQRGSREGSLRPLTFTPWVGRNAPDKPHIIRERVEVWPDFAACAISNAARRVAKSARLVKIAYIGVWDAVGAPGIFHDM